MSTKQKTTEEVFNKFNLNLEDPEDIKECNKLINEALHDLIVTLNWIHEKYPTCNIFPEEEQANLQEALNTKPS